MQIGIFAKTFPGSAPLAVLQAVARAGYETCQYNMACSGLAPLPLEISADAIASISRAQTQTGVGIAALSATYNMINPDRDARQKGLQSLRVLAAAARALNIPLLTLCTGSRNPRDQWTHHPDNQSPQAWTDLRHEMDLALQVAEAFDICLGMEPEHANVINSAAAARRLLDETGSKRLKIVLDPANLVTTETGAAQHHLISHAIDTLASSITLAHAKDRDPAGKVVAAGLGVIDFPFFMSGLQNLGRHIPLITHGLDAREAATVSTFLRNARDAS
jgi:sugar phosphate isomerase/epimerase